MTRDEPTIRGIPEAVARRFRITPRALLSRRRDRQVARPRQVAMWLSWCVAHASLCDIARYFERDHKTVIAGINRVTALMECSPSFAETVLELAKQLDSAEAASLRQTMVRVAA